MPDTNDEHISDDPLPVTEATDPRPAPDSPMISLPTENTSDPMEVHHHAHHGTHKNWKSYGWEFLMLFLAVFCGSLAEYQLEHVVEHQREEKYIAAVLKETRTDIAEYDSLLKRIYYIDPIADSLFHNVKWAGNYGFKLERKWNTPFNHTKVSYFPSLATIRQLEHSGNLRLIRNQDLLQEIVTYETFVDGGLKTSGTNVEECLKTSYKMENTLCDLTDFNRSLSSYLAKTRNTTAHVEEESFDMPLLTRDPLKLNELASSFADFRGYLNGYILAITEAKNKALALNKKITEEYHLE